MGFETAPGYHTLHTVVWGAVVFPNAKGILIPWGKVVPISVPKFVHAETCEI